MKTASIIVSGGLLADCLRATADALDGVGGVALFPDQFPLLSFMALMLWDNPEARAVVMAIINKMNAEVLDGGQRVARVPAGTGR